MRLVVVVVVSVNRWSWGALELADGGLMVRLGGGNAVLFVLSDVRPVIGLELYSSCSVVPLLVDDLSVGSCA
jgi:hypothetical protein